MVTAAILNLLPVSISGYAAYFIPATFH